MVFGRCASRESIPAFQSDGRREVVSIGILLVRKLLLYFDGNLTPNFLSRGPFLGGVEKPPIHKAMVYNDAAMRKKDADSKMALACHHGLSFGLSYSLFH